jgi:hypothetical protein
MRYVTSGKLVYFVRGARGYGGVDDSIFRIIVVDIRSCIRKKIIIIRGAKM